MVCNIGQIVTEFENAYNVCCLSIVYYLSVVRYLTCCLLPMTVCFSLPPCQSNNTSVLIDFLI